MKKSELIEETIQNSENNIKEFCLQIKDNFDYKDMKEKYNNMINKDSDKYIKILYNK